MISVTAMFKNLYRKICYPLFFLALALIIFINAFASVALIEAMSDTYASMGNKRLTRIMNSCKLYLSSAETTTYNLSLEEELISELCNPTGVPLMQKLNDACNYSHKINAISVYSDSGEIYTSANVGGVPTLNKLKEDKDIAQFLESDKDDYISFRTRIMASIYGNMRYEQSMGVISCCRKVYNNGETVGVIFADILPVNLYAYVSGEGQFDNAISFISFNGDFFSYGDNASNEKLLSSSKHSGYFKHSARSDDNLYTLTVFDSKKEYTSKIAILISVMVIASALLIVGVFFGSRLIAKSVTSRLDKFLNKMNAQQLP